MTDPTHLSDLDDVIDPHEQTHPDHREHAKASNRPDDDELARRTEHERAEVEHDRAVRRPGQA